MICISITALAMNAALFMLLNLGSVRDGLNGRPAGVGWLKFHLLLWAQRNLPGGIIALVGIIYEPRFWWLYACTIFTHTLHRWYYRWAETHLGDFAGNPNAPAWWYKFMKVYLKIFPWA